MFLSIVLLIIGLAIVIFGADLLVKGSSSISKKAGIPPIVIGLTIVSFGTSAPELVVNVFSAINGTTDLAIGNVIGSNIANILLVLGLSSLVMSLKVKKSTVWKEIPLAFLAVLVVLFLANDIFLSGNAANVLTRTDGFVLLSFFAIFLYYTVELFRNGGDEDTQEKIKAYPFFVSIVFVVSGLLMLFFGGQLSVGQAVVLAKLAGLSEMLIGLTIVAVGTSLPELATSVVAAKKGHMDIAIGNIVGSNIFNIFWILGITSIIRPLPINTGVNFDIMVCLFATLILFLAMFVGKKHQLERWQGGVLVLLYVVYMVFLVQRG